MRRYIPAAHEQCTCCDPDFPCECGCLDTCPVHGQRPFGVCSACKRRNFNPTVRWCKCGGKILPAAGAPAAPPHR